MPFKLFSLPYLVLLDITKQMGCSEMFIISLCSSKTRRFIENVWNRHVDTVRYCIAATGIKAFLYNQNRESLLVFAKGVEEFLPHQRTSITRIGDFSGPLYFDNANRVFYLKSDPNARNSFYEHVHRLISQSSPIVQLKIWNDGNKDFVNMLPYVQGVKNLFIQGKTMEAERLDGLFDKYRHLDSAIIVPEIVGIFYVNTQIYNIPNLCCAYSARLTVSLLRYFTGTNLRLKNAKCDCWEIIGFLRKWMAGEAYTNLKTLWIQFSYDHIFDYNAVRRRFNFPMWGTDRPHVYMYDEGVFGGINKLLPIECMFYSAVERESDKKMASLLLQNGFVFFFVWNNEQQE